MAIEDESTGGKITKGLVGSAASSVHGGSEGSIDDTLSISFVLGLLEGKEGSDYLADGFMYGFDYSIGGSIVGGDFLRLDASMYETELKFMTDKF